MAITGLIKPLIEPLAAGEVANSPVSSGGLGFAGGSSARSKPTRNPKLFISSTCYDLLDVRAELRAFLEEHGVSVAMSDDAYSDFVVNPSDDSIASCLNVIEASDAILCIIDRRYGGVLKTKNYSGMSATHVEVQHARKIRKPIFTFIREAAFQEFDQLRRSAGFETRWVEPGRPNMREKWVGFVKELSSLPRTHNLSNWCDTFTSSVDLKKLAYKRVGDYFPSSLSALKAFEPGRVVRLCFSPFRSALATGRSNEFVLQGSIKNFGMGPALDVTCVCTYSWLGTLMRCPPVAANALGVNETLDICFEVKPVSTIKQSIIYRNIHNDIYTVECELKWDHQRYMQIGGETFSAVTSDTPLETYDELINATVTSIKTDDQSDKAFVGNEYFYG